ncbi:hypothetical protein Godav_027817, partial [Gossypium davidsonii]|nr:hypothetical protein [Gossypium davidsonii]MBA0672169.1 hypothetical protein [Gossypium klotzschianum]
ELKGFPALSFEESKEWRYSLKKTPKSEGDEWGFEPSMIQCQQIWPLVQYRRWERFYIITKDFVVVLIVQEFYAFLRDQESRGTEGVTWETVPVQGKDVRFTLSYL